MGLFRKKEKVLKQDLNQKSDHPGMVFIIHLLMENKCDIPEKEFMTGIMQKHLGEVNCFSHSDEMAGFSPMKYSVHFEKDNADVPPQLMIMKCIDIKQPLLDDIAQSQLWDCKDSEQILNTCKYQVIATDMLAAGLDYKERAEMLVDYVEALVEMFPTCKAVLFENSKKMYTRDAILNCSIPKESKFIYYAVNARFFNIEGGEDMLVDTLGMSQDIQWRVQYEDALIQPVRPVIDINMGEFASGSR